MPTLNLTAVSLAFLASIAMCCVGSSALPVCAFASHAPAIKLLASRKHYNHLVYLKMRAAISFFPLSTGQQLSTSTPPYLTRIECPSSCAMSSLDTLLCQSHFQVCLLQLASQRATTRATGLQGMATRPLEAKALKCLRTSGGNNAQHKTCPTGTLNIVHQQQQQHGSNMLARIKNPRLTASSTRFDSMRSQSDTGVCCHLAVVRCRSIDSRVNQLGCWSTSPSESLRCQWSSPNPR